MGMGTSLGVSVPADTHPHKVMKKIDKVVISCIKICSHYFLILIYLVCLNLMLVDTEKMLLLIQEHN